MMYSPHYSFNLVICPHFLRARTYVTAPTRKPMSLPMNKQLAAATGPGRAVATIASRGTDAERRLAGAARRGRPLGSRRR